MNLKASSAKFHRRSESAYIQAFKHLLFFEFLLKLGLFLTKKDDFNGERSHFKMISTWQNCYFFPTQEVDSA